MGQRSPVSTAAFLRRFDLAFPLAVAAMRLRFDGVAVEDGVARAAVRLPGAGMLGGTVAMELLLSPWACCGSRTMVELVPRGRVHPGPAYFSAGHALLDTLATQLGAAG